MKRAIIISAALLLLATGCETNIYKIGEQDAFKGRYAPSLPIQQIRYDIHEEGAEASIDSLTYFNHWLWDNRGRLTRIEYDIEQSYYTNGPIHDEYYYDNNDRIDSIKHYVEGSTSTPVRTYKFHYTDGLLSKITFSFGQDNTRRTTEFRYHSGSQYPYAIVYIHPLQTWLVDIYHTDTLIQTWTLEWNNGNLIRATADSMAWYCTGLSHIDYFYDNHYNPLQGLFIADIISQDGFVDDPTTLCRNNLVRRVLYHYNQQRDVTTTTENYWNYHYRNNDGYPTNVTSSYESLYWTIFNVRTSFSYGEPYMEE